MKLARILFALVLYSPLFATQNGDEMGYHLRKSADRGYFDLGWLKTYHTFSFGEYYDEAFMGFRTLRVINEDRVKPGKGFDTHSHRDMEILTFVIDGELSHKDSMGNGSTIRGGEIQLISAGKGIKHSEFNNSDGKEVHLLQIWIEPDKKGLEPSYQQKKLSLKDNAWILLASKKGEENSFTIHQDAKVYFVRLDGKMPIEKTLPKNRHGWLQMVSGELELDGLILSSGDGVAIDPGTNFKGLSTPNKPAQFLFFELL